MGHPEITADQREMAVVLLANAMRKDVHVRARAHTFREQGDTLHGGMMKRRSEPSQRYVEGMRDILRVLFANGHALTEECMEEAYARAMGTSSQFMNNGDRTPYH